MMNTENYVRIYWLHSIYIKILQKALLDTVICI